MKRPELVWVNQFAVNSGMSAGTRHLELCKCLSERGWKTRVVASDFNLHTRGYLRRKGTSRGEIGEVSDGVAFTWLWAASYSSNTWRRAWNWLTFGWKAWRYLESSARTVDVLIGSSPQLLAALAAQRAAQRLKIPFVFEVRDLWPESLSAVTGRQGPAYQAMKRVADYLYERADRIVVLSPGVHAYLVEAGVAPDKIVCIPNGTRADGSALASGSRSLPPFRLVYAGAHGPANGLEIVLEAASLLQGNAPVDFLLVGDGPSKPALLDRAGALGLSNVEFRAPVPKAEIAELLTNCSAGLMVLRDTPLFSFGVSPNKLFDYLGAGIPVVCNVPGEVSAMLQEAKAGVQADGPDGKALAAAALRFVELDEATRVSMGQSGQRWVTRNHSFDVLAQRLDPVLRELAQA